jgi:hypothetical protein
LTPATVDLCGIMPKKDAAYLLEAGPYTRAITLSAITARHITSSTEVRISSGRCAIFARWAMVKSWIPPIFSGL